MNKDQFNQLIGKLQVVAHQQIIHRENKVDIVWEVTGLESRYVIRNDAKFVSMHGHPEQAVKAFEKQLELNNQ